MSLKEEVVRNRIVHFYEANIDRGKIFTVNHFLNENIARSTIYSILKRKQVTRKAGSGKKPTKLLSKQKKWLKSNFNNKDGLSQRDAARKLKCTQPHICKALKKIGLRCRKKQRSPDYTPEQIKLVKSQCRYMVRNYGRKSFVLDDESYFPLSRSQMPGNNVFYTNDISNTPSDIKYKFKKKFENKVMLYIVISDRGVSKPWFKPSGLAINQEVYQNQCLRKILVPFIKKHHSDNNYIFWPDKASSHYAKKTLDYLTAENIPFVPKIRNPTNLPQCRPIEDFFGNLSSLVYKNNWKAKNIQQLKNRMRLCIKKMDISAVQRQCGNIVTKLRRVSDHGPFAEIH